MGFVFVGLATLGLLGVIANLLSAAGKIVVGLLRYVIRPVILFFLIMCILDYLNKRGF